MSSRQRVREIWTGFEPAFWIANVTELFERLSYYAQSAVLAIFLHESLRFSAQQTGQLMGWFGFAVWFLPILGGSLADRFGFRNSLLFAYLILTAGYFLMGSLGTDWMAPLRDRLPLYWLVLAVLMVPALGPSLVKPVVAGTTACASTESVRSIGYSIYYTLVNVGGVLGPAVAYEVRSSFGIQNVFRASAVFVFAMFWVTLLFYREPTRSGERPAASVGEALRNMFAVLANLRFVAFLLIFSGFWVMFWGREFIALPLFLRGFVRPERQNLTFLLLVDPATVIALQILLSYLTRKLPALHGNDAGHPHRRRVLAHPRRPPHDGFRDRHALCAGLGGDSAIRPLLRIRLPAGTGWPTRHLHGLCFFARGHRLFHRRTARRVPGALLR